MKKILSLLVVMLVAIGASASDIVYVGNYVNSFHEEGPCDIYLYYTGNAIDSLEIVPASMNVNSPSLVLRGESAITKFVSRIKKAQKKWEEMKELHNKVWEKNVIELLAVTIPKMYMSGMASNAHTAYETIYFNGNKVYPDAFFYLKDAEHSLFVIEAKNLIGVAARNVDSDDTFFSMDLNYSLNAYLAFESMESVDKFCSLISIDTLRGRIISKESLKKMSK